MVKLPGGSREYYECCFVLCENADFEIIISNSFVQPKDLNPCFRLNNEVVLDDEFDGDRSDVLTDNGWNCAILSLRAKL